MMNKQGRKLMRLSRVTAQSRGARWKSRMDREDKRRRGLEILLEAQRYWMGMWRFRKDRERNKNYTYGRQWDDVVCVDGEKITEAEMIRRQGNVPLKNNLIRKIMRTVLGVYRNQSSEPTCTARDRDEQKYGETMSTVLQCNMQLNRMNQVYARSMEEFLISGFVVHRKFFGWRNDKLDCWTDYVQPNNFFIDSNMRDFRGWDVSCVGEIHDISFTDLCATFGRSAGDVKKLEEVYLMARDRGALTGVLSDFGYDDGGGYSFLVPRDGTRCRVIEVWRKESKPRYRCHDMNSGEIYKIETGDYGVMVEQENEERLRMAGEFGIPEGEVPLIEAEWFVDSFWRYYYLTPFGDILEEGETPYEHRSHPYVFCVYPFIDGEIHSFVADFIDQQRYVNRLITMYDWIMRASAKGVLLFPEECLPEGMTMDDVADEWTRFNGVIMIKANNKGMLPQQVANNCTHVGIAEMLNIQLKFLDDISGATGALQGKPGFSGMSAALYSQQTQNATTTLFDLLETFSDFVKEGAYKDVKNIQQYYDRKRVFNIAGRKASLVEYDPEKIRDVEFDLSVVESTTTPAFRMLANDFLMQIWQSGQITLEQLLEQGDFPFADNLLQSIKVQKEEMKNGEQPGGISPELLDQARQGADMEAVEQARGMLAG